ncbi:hypothetical protein HYW17_03670 [Candidatus Uhrbacteria bacterium]|nr:hypothetical protein [Candidatus Uhrbacteria bacterium]
MSIVIIGFGVFLFSLLAVWIVGSLAYRWGFVVYPQKNRWHTKPVALYGGVGIGLAFAAGIGSVLILFDIGPLAWKLSALALGALTAFVVGLVDDRLNIKPATKLIGQIIAVSIPIAAGVVLAATPWHLVNVLLTFFWFIAIMNAMNLLDNMDGLASGIAIIAALTFIALRIIAAGAVPQDILFAAAVVFVYVLAGFWIFNRYPASIFMGDSGSLFIGYMLAALAIPLDRSGLLKTSSAMLTLILPIAVLAIPIFDTLLVSFNRIWHGHSPFQGGKDHSSHRLVGLGFSEDHAVLILYGFSVVGGLVAIAIQLWQSYAVPLLIFYGIFLILVGLYLGRVKTYQEPAEGEQKGRWTPLVTEFLYKRRAAEVLLDFLIISASYYGAYYLRFEGLLREQAAYYVQSLPLIVAACLIGFYISGVYRGLWRLITVADLGRYMKGVIVGVGMSVFLIAIIYQFNGYSRAVFINFGFLLFLFVTGSRLSMRILDEVIRERAWRGKTVNIVVYGAGKAGKLLYEECLQNPNYGQHYIVGFVDDDPNKWNLAMAGLVIHKQEDFISGAAEAEHTVHEIWVSSANVKEERVRAFARGLEQKLSHPVKVRQFSVRIEEFDKCLPS